MKERNFSDLHEFCNEACNSDISTVILCYTDEWGPTPGAGHAVHCGPRLEMLVLAYSGGEIWRCQISGAAAERSIVQDQVSACGLKWKLRSRNTAHYGGWRASGH